MDTSFGLYVPILVVFSLISGITSSQLYLQPSKPQHGYFTGESFFITCFTTDESIDQLTWSDSDDNRITATEGRIHVQPTDGSQRGLRLVVESVEKQDVGIYTCSDLHLSVEFELVVYRSISFGDTQKFQRAPEGGKGVIRCHVSADPAPSVYYSFNGTTIKDNAKYQVTEDGLEIFNLSRSDAGDYKCKGIVVTPLTTSVNEMEITFHVEYSPDFLPDQKTVAYVTIGSLANLSCSASADPIPMFQWIRDEETLHNSTDYRIYNTNNQSILQMTIDDQYALGDYICRASNPHGWKEVTIDLKEGNTAMPPSLSISGEDQESVKITINHSGNKQGQELRVTGFKIEYIMTAETWDKAVSQEFDLAKSYELKNMSHSTAYVFRAAARNAAGFSDYSDEVEYTTHSLQVASVIAGSASSLVVSSLSLIASLFLMF